MRVATLAGRSLRFLLLLSTLTGAWHPAPARALDVTGKWLLDVGIPSGTPADFVQSGSNLSIDLGLVLTGTINPSGSFGVSNGSTATCLYGLGGLIVGDTRLAATAGTVGATCGFFASAATGMRCECFDGNTVSGDGCDARCQIEPCFTCTGSPSVCSPSPDGAPCDDRNACTSGETCTAGVCGGGTPVSPCINLTGQWIEHAEIPEFSISSDAIVDIAQVGTVLDFNGSPTAVPAKVGTIDPTTGAVTVASGNGQLFCPTQTVTGTAAADGNSYTLTGTAFQQVSDYCVSASVTITGTRCNGPCVLPTTTTTSTTSTTSTTLAVDLLSGKRLLMTDGGDARKRKLQVKSTDGGLSAGLGNGSVDDPTVSGATVLVRTTLGCPFIPCDTVYSLPADHWTLVGKPGQNVGYKYRDATLAAGPFRSGTLKPGKLLSLAARGPQLLNVLTQDPRPVDVEITIGLHRMCLTFGGTITFKTGAAFRAKDAPAAIACPQ
jgi:cysteine-rich repeat protein